MFKIAITANNMRLDEEKLLALSTEDLKAEVERTTKEHKEDEKDSQKYYKMQTAKFALKKKLKVG